MASRPGNVQHLEINVSNLPKSSEFYEGLLTWLGYKRVVKERDFEGWGNGDFGIWLTKCFEPWSKFGFHRRRVGLNHFAFRAESRDTVDRFYKEFLIPRRVTVLYNGPKEYPEYAPEYYAVYFEDPDRLKLEFVYSRIGGQRE